MKNITYFLALSAIPNVAAVAWVTTGFRDFGASSDAPWMPFVWGLVVCGAVFEPILIHRPVNRRIGVRSLTSLTVRGFAAGSVIVLVGSVLFVIANRLPECEIVMIVLGYLAALAIGVAGVRLGDA